MVFKSDGFQVWWFSKLCYVESWDLREQMDSEGTDGTEHRDLSGPLPLQLEQLSQNKTNTTVKQAFRQYKPLLELEGPVRELKFPPPPPTSHVNRPWASPSAFSGSQQTSNSSCQLKIVRQLQGNLHTIWKQGEQLLIGSGLPLAKSKVISQVTIISLLFLLFPTEEA